MCHQSTLSPCTCLTLIEHFGLQQNLRQLYPLSGATSTTQSAQLGDVRLSTIDLKEKESLAPQFSLSANQYF